LSASGRRKPPRALITGGNGNLGQAVARLLEDDGVEVHVTVYNEETRASFAYGLMKENLTVHVADLSKDADVKKLFEVLGSPLSALVVTVGGYVAGPFAEVDEATMDSQYALNLKSALLSLRYAYPALKAAPGGGSCVLIANRPSVLGAGPGGALTTAMKAGVVSLVKSLAEEWKEDGITVNAVAPGIMDTPQNRRDMPDVDPKRWPSTEQVARVVRFLLSQEASIVSGAVLPAFGRS
jgi:NAD(P)-dependent dehydrogenase (short-subunit alcohol dehydrogenase family)